MILKIGAMIALLVLVTISGCTPEAEYLAKQQQIRVINSRRVAEAEVVGTTPDGLVVRRAVVQWLPKRGYSVQEHVLYFVGASVTHENLDAGIDKVNPRPLSAIQVKQRTNLSDDEVITLADKIKTEREATEAAEYNRLKEKFEKRD